VLQSSTTITMGCCTFFILSIVLSSVVSNPQFSYRSDIYGNGSYSTIPYIPQIPGDRPTNQRIPASTSILWHTLGCVQAGLPASTRRICQTPGDHPNPGFREPVKRWWPTTPIPELRKSSRDRVCINHDCVQAAADLINQMDLSTHPCNDFYQFACGGFVDVNAATLPEHKSRTGKSTILQDQLNFRLKRLFESESEWSEPFVYSSVRLLYKTCMESNMDTEDLEEKLGILIDWDWPVVDVKNWDRRYGKNFKWYDLAKKARDEGFDYNQMISVDISVDPKDSEKKIIEIDQPQFGLDREYLIKGLDDRNVKAYFNYMVQTAKLLGAEEKFAKKEMKKVIEMEIELAKMSLPRERRRNKTALYNPMTIFKANRLYPDISLGNYINSILGSRYVVHYEDDIVNVKVPQYLTDFKEYISWQPSHVQANYIIWRIIKEAMNYMNEEEEASEIQLTYEKTIHGKTQKTPRWEKCVQSTAGLKNPNLYFKEGSLSNAIDAMYAKEHFDLGAKEVIDKIVENVRSEFKKMLYEETWIDYTTKAKALMKVDQITPHVAYAKEILDTPRINEYYNGLNLTHYDSFLYNILDLKKFIYDYNIREFRNPIDKRSWKTHGEGNSIQFPAGMLEGIYSEKETPFYLNYGAIGVDVGHEIAHGFDDEGSQYDGQGNLVDWWEAKTKKKYLKKAQCIIDQYGNYTVEVEGEVLNVNGITTQGDNIADNGGIKAVFRAYETLVSKYGPQARLPGLPYTPRQLLWLTVASKQCEVRTPASLRHQVLTDHHPPARVRINAAFSNMERFAEDWECPVWSPMNPYKKCSLW